MITLNMSTDLDIDTSVYVDSYTQVGKLKINSEMPQPRNSPINFISANTRLGTLIMPRNDYQQFDALHTCGIGHQLMATGTYEQPEIDISVALLHLRSQTQSRPIVALDCGANIGLLCMAWDRHIHDITVHAFEAQEKIYYALCGNLVMNNCLRVHAHYRAIGAHSGSITVPVPDYAKNFNYGGLSLVNGNLDAQHTQGYLTVDMVSIDELPLDHVDFIKMDIEGMEISALAGAVNTIKKHRPILVVEAINVDSQELRKIMRDLGYHVWRNGLNYIGIHENDPCREKILV